MQQVTARPARRCGGSRRRPTPLDASVSSRPWLRTDVRSARSRYALPPPRVWKLSQLPWRPRQRLAGGLLRAPSLPGSLAVAPWGSDASSSSNNNWIEKPGPGTARSLVSLRLRLRLRSAGRPLPAAARRPASTTSRGAPTRSWMCPGTRRTSPRRSPTRTRTDSARSTSRRKEVSASQHVRSPSTIFTRAKVSVTSFFNSTSKRKTWQAAGSPPAMTCECSDGEILRKTNAEEQGVTESHRVGNKIRLKKPSLKYFCVIVNHIEQYLRRHYKSRYKNGWVYFWGKNKSGRPEWTQQYAISTLKLLKTHRIGNLRSSTMSFRRVFERSVRLETVRPVGGVLGFPIARSLFIKTARFRKQRDVASV